MRTAVLVLATAFVMAACKDTPSTAPQAAAGELAVLKAAPPNAVVVDHGDGTSTLIFQPGPGLNNGTDQGTLDAGKDASVLIHDGGQFNYGNSGWLNHFASNCNGWNALSFYRFNVSDLPDPTDVISVKLSLYHTLLRAYNWGWQSPTTSFSLHPVLADWNEMTVLYTTKPPYGGAVATTTVNSSVGRSIPTGQGHHIFFEGWATMDITALYNAWKAGAMPNHGVAYRRINVWCENANATWTASSDIIDVPGSPIPQQAAFRPKLEIRYRSATVNRPPTVTIAGPATVAEGSPIAFGANGVDPDGDALTYAWQFDDGFTASGMAVSRTFVDNGAHSATVTVSDGNGGTANATANFTVSNVAPSVAATLSAEILAGETAVGSGAFSDPGADTWTASVLWGDGSPSSSLVLDGFSFALAHRFVAAGSYIVSVSVADDDGGVGSVSRTVTVISLDSWLDRLIARINAAGYEKGLTTSLVKKLEAARKSLLAGNMTAFRGQIGAFRNELDATVKTNRVPAADAAVYTTMLDRLLAVL